MPTLRRLVEDAHDIPLVITQPTRGAGRGRRATPTPVAECASELGLPILEAEDVNEPSVVQRIGELEPQVGIVIAFGQKIGGDLRATAPGGYLNLHASLLPKYRGAAPINWAIVHGEEKTGCTVFRIVERMDAGPILSSRWTWIKPDETADELHDRLAGIGVDAVKAALEMYAEGDVPEGTAQNDAEATKAPKLKKRNGFVDFNRDARRVLDHFRGMTPWPGAQAVYAAEDGRWEKVQLVTMRRAEVPGKPDIPPGTIDERLFVAARDAFLEILELKPSSGRTMTWPEYVNGRHVKAGDRLLTPDP